MTTKSERVPGRLLEAEARSRRRLRLLVVGCVVWALVLVALALVWWA